MREEIIELLNQFSIKPINDLNQSISSYGIDDIDILEFQSLIESKYKVEFTYEDEFLFDPFMDVELTEFLLEKPVSELINEVLSKL